MHDSVGSVYEGGLVELEHLPLCVCSTFLHRRMRRASSAVSG
jgi:hypothetical protein